MAVDCLVQGLAFVNLGAVCAQHQVTLFQPGLLTRTPGHNTRNYDVLAQSVRKHPEPQSRRRAHAMAMTHKFVAAGHEVFARNPQDWADEIREIQVTDRDDLSLRINYWP